MKIGDLTLQATFSVTIAKSKSQSLLTRINSDFSTGLFLQTNTLLTASRSKAFPSKFVDELLGILKKPLIGTSANLSGQPSCQTADEAYRQLGPSVDFWLDGGTTKGGMPSTMLDATEPNFRIIREGAISSEVIRPFL